MKPRDVWHWLAVAVAAGTLAMGLAVDLPPRGNQPRQPAWAAHLAPLRNAPLPTATPVSLILPPGLRTADTEKLVMETVWQRPDVDWIPATGFPSGNAPRTAVLLEPSGELQPPPPGWTRVWSRGWIQLLRRNVP